MYFYGHKIPNDRKYINKRLKELIKSSEINCIGCSECPIRFDGVCMATDDSFKEKYPKFKSLYSSTVRDILYKEYLNLPEFTIIQEELDI